MTVDLSNLITTLGLDKKTLARVLFPHTKHPDIVLSRALQKRSKLDEQQLFALATFTGFSIDALYKSAMFWKSVTQNHIIRFTNGQYTALYDTNTGITKILLLGKQIALHTLSSKTTTITEYFQSINQLIIKQSIQKS